MSELENRVHAGELAARASSVGCACGVRTCCRRRRRRPRLLQKPQHPHSRRHINTHTQKRLQQIRAARGESLGLFLGGGGVARPPRARSTSALFPTHKTNKPRSPCRLPPPATASPRSLAKCTTACAPRTRASARRCCCASSPVCRVCVCCWRVCAARALPLSLSPSNNNTQRQHTKYRRRVLPVAGARRAHNVHQPRGLRQRGDQGDFVFLPVCFVLTTDTDYVALSLSLS